MEKNVLKKKKIYSEFYCILNSKSPGKISGRHNFTPVSTKLQLDRFENKAIDRPLYTLYDFLQGYLTTSYTYKIFLKAILWPLTLVEELTQLSNLFLSL